MGPMFSLHIGGIILELYQSNFIPQTPLSSGEASSTILVKIYVQYDNSMFELVCSATL